MLKSSCYQLQCYTFIAVKPVCAEIYAVKNGYASVEGGDEVAMDQRVKDDWKS